MLKPVVNSVDMNGNPGWALSLVNDEVEEPDVRQMGVAVVADATPEGWVAAFRQLATNIEKKWK